MDSLFIGRLCEERAASWYRGRGYNILCRNYRTREGEIDIIARKGDTLVFAEVKSVPPSWEAGDLQRKISPAKRIRLRKTASAYLAYEVNDVYHFIRFDAVFVCGNDITCIEGAF